jgi:hypothetical protein
MSNGGSSELACSFPDLLLEGTVMIHCRFYYVDERQLDGGPTIPVNGSAAGDMYVELAEKKEQGPWHYTFVKDKGYVEFK